MFYQEKVINACSLGSPGMTELRWLKPVRPGDTLRTLVEVTGKRPSRSKPDRGTVDFSFQVLNQDDEAVMTFQSVSILARGPG